MLERFSDETDPAKASALCLACSLLPDAVALGRLPTGPLEEFADDPTADPDQLVRALNALGLAALRSSNLAQAREYAESANFRFQRFA